MNELDFDNLAPILARIRMQCAKENVRITQHAQQEMIEEDITFDEISQAINTAQILENYPEHR